MKPGDLRKFKMDMPLKSDKLVGRPFLVVKHRIGQDGTHLSASSLMAGCGNWPRHGSFSIRR